MPIPHILDHPGIVQATLRDVTGWGPRDYWFPEIRSLGGAAAMLTLVLYPYVYLLAPRGVQDAGGDAVLYAARSLGASALGAFSARLPAHGRARRVAAGALLVVMETIADFGTVAHFSVQTFATGIYTSWFGLADRGAAAQLALGLLTFAFLVAFLEQQNRGARRPLCRQRTTGTLYPHPPARRAGDMGRSSCAAYQSCSAWSSRWSRSLPWACGRSRTSSLHAMSGSSRQRFCSPASPRSVTVGREAVMLGTFHRVMPSRVSAIAPTLSRLGYAVPGGVIAVGLLVPFAGFDNWLDGRMEAWVRHLDGALLITGSIWLMIAAYMIRFLAAAIGAYDSGLSTVTPNMDAASRVLGRSTWGTVRDIHLPVLRPSVLTALLIVFVDTIKELPATLILRPFNYDTLAVHAFRLASDERLEGAAVPSLMIAGIGLIPVIFLCYQISDRRALRGATATI